MTPADKLFAEPPEMTILGPLGSFRLFGTPGNDFATAEQILLVADTLSWVARQHRPSASAGSS